MCGGGGLMMCEVLVVVVWCGGSGVLMCSIDDGGCVCGCGICMIAVGVVCVGFVVR